MSTALTDLLDQASTAAATIAASSTAQRDLFLAQFALNLKNNQDTILAANAADVAAAKEAQLAAPLCNRLDLSGGNFDAMLASIAAVAKLADPIGTVFDQQVHGDITVGKMRVPLGIVCFIFESRPNVTADGAALCLKSGNVAILRGGKEALATNMAIAAQAHAALEQAELPTDALVMIPTPDREEMDALLADPRLDLVIPRGGSQLVAHVFNTAKAPVLAHEHGNCYLYVDARAEIDVAIKVIANAKMQRPGTCNALESLLIHSEIAEQLLPQLAESLSEVQLRGCEQTCAILGEACTPATAADWDTEYLDLILAIKVIANLDDAIAWINTHGSAHSDGILSTDQAAIDKFVREVDSASVLVNTSTRFADGFMYGLGAETGISTGKLHARGPVGLAGLTSTKWVVTSSGSIRT